MDSVIIGILVVLVIFFICRELVCWYWKINESITLLTEIRDALVSASKNQAKEPKITSTDDIAF
jgi:hypothetical protein